MPDAKKDHTRALAACHEILDNRHPIADRASVLVTLEHTIAAMLIAVMDGKPLLAVGMLHEGVLPGVEERIALFASRQGKPR